MTDEVVVTNLKTGAKELKTLGYFLPLYDIGDIVGYKQDPDDKMELESEITGIEMSVDNDGDKVTTTAVYRLLSGDIIDQQDIVSYYHDVTPEVEEAVEYEPGDEVCYVNGGLQAVTKVLSVDADGDIRLTNGYIVSSNKVSSYLTKVAKAPEQLYKTGDIVEYWDQETNAISLGSIVNLRVVDSEYEYYINNAWHSDGFIIHIYEG